MNKKALVLSLMASMFLASCGTKPAPSSEPKPATSVPEPEPEVQEVNVFVLSGQSNMEGNTSYKNGDNDYLATAITDLGYDEANVCYDGIPEVLSSTYCAGYGQLNHNNLNGNSQVSATNTENRFEGKFIPTKVGLGTGNGSKMGPELGCAYGLRNFASEDAPIFFIKMASNGSGFEQSGTQYNWPVKDADGNWPEINLYHTFAKPFIDNNLKLIEGMGYKPVMRGWLWHQGESDTGSAKTAKYAQRLGDMVELFRNDFADIAPDQDGANIGFIDGMICESSTWTDPDKMNAEKQKFADSNDMNFIVDTYGNEAKIPENELKTGNPGGDQMHYNTKSSFRLGMAYANIIIDNGLLD